MEIKRFFSFSFFTRSYRGLNFEENRVSSVDFIHIFGNFLTKISLIFLKFAKIILTKCCLFYLKRQKSFIGYFSFIFLSKILAKYFKIQTFSSKTARNNFFGPFCLNLQEVHTQKLLTQPL